jgi:hypothetical protein
MFCPNDTWISAQLPDLKKFGGPVPAPPGPPADTSMSVNKNRDEVEVFIHDNHRA